MPLSATVPLTLLDVCALIFFLACWMGYPAFAAWRGAHLPSLAKEMNVRRRRWISRMIERENRMTDVNIVRNLARSSQFFASTTMLILGALVALMGYTEKAATVMAELPFTVRTSERLWEIKVLLLIVIYVYTFFKLSWSIRQFNYCSTLVGGAPAHTPDPEQHADEIDTITHIISFASENFNNGLRSYYFSLAALAWFVQPWLMMATTIWVVGVLYAREFNSRTLQELTAKPAAPE
jgi:uncharacterized membrane protein